MLVGALYRRSIVFNPPPPERFLINLAASGLGTSNEGTTVISRENCW